MTTNSTHAPSYAFLVGAPRGVLAFYSEEQLRAALAEVATIDSIGAREVEHAILRELGETPIFNYEDR